MTKKIFVFICVCVGQLLAYGVADIPLHDTLYVMFGAAIALTLLWACEFLDRDKKA